MRVLIIGVGGVGAMAAWQLAKAGHAVVALEQFGIDHDRGSSYGDSRIVRRVYPDSLYTALMGDAYALWNELKAEAADPDLFVSSGGLFFGPGEHPDVRAAQHAMEASGVPYEVFDARECARRFPAFALSREEIALYEPSMGYARASRCVRAATGLARRYGAVIQEGEAVTGIYETGGGIAAETRSGARFEADRLLLTMGPWLPSLLEARGCPLPLAVTRQPYVHLRPVRNESDFEPGRFPVWIDAAANTYGFPRLGDLPGVKIGLHDFGAATDPEAVNRAVEADDIAGVCAYAERRFPWLGPEALYAKVCLYTVTPDNDFVIDAVPGMPGAYFISACSGHGFKFTPLMGRIAADLVTGVSAPYDLSRFRLDRFAAP